MGSHEHQLLHQLAEHIVNANLNELSPREVKTLKRIAGKLQKHPAVKLDLDSEAPSLGDRVADKVAEFGGSWTFILGFLGFLLFWTLLNALILSSNAFDPYPFIFLNLVLSMVAALQAPIIMMSQNRQAERDRMVVLRDFDVNLRAEVSIQQLHTKMDQFQEILSLHKPEWFAEDSVKQDNAEKNPPTC